MNFTELCLRLLGRLRRLLESGVTTESALARRLGVSQPHLHNTLKGVRSLTLSTADQVLASMGWSVLDLLSDEELRLELPKRKSAKSKTRDLPVRLMRTLIGNCQAPPDKHRGIPRTILAALSNPALLAVDPDTDTGGLAECGDILLADLACNSELLPEWAYLFFWDGKYRIRWARRGARCVYLSTQHEWRQPAAWDRMEKLQPIARIHAIAKRPTDMFQRPVPPSAAN